MPISRPFAVDRAGAAPERMGGGGEDRLVEEIFPIAGELLLADHHRPDRLGSRAGRHRHLIAELRLARSSELERRTIERAQRLHQAEAGLAIDRERVSGGDAAFGVGEPDALGLHDQIADRQHQTALADDDAAARPLLAQRLGGESVLGNRRLHRDDRFERAIQIDAGASDSAGRLAVRRVAASQSSAQSFRFKRRGSTRYFASPAAAIRERPQHVQAPRHCDRRRFYGTIMAANVQSAPRPGRGCAPRAPTSGIARRSSCRSGR